MATVQFRFYEELNDFLPRRQRKVAFDHGFRASASVKDMIESLGVPHPEVDLILVNGISVDFNYLLRDGDQVSVYPTFETLDITPVTRLRPQPLREPCFVLDVHLGKLARYLRLLGFDGWYSNDAEDEALAQLAHREHRILLTRDLGLLKRSVVTRGLFVRATQPGEQLLEVVRRLDLWRRIQPFGRCMTCNGVLVAVAKEQVANKLPPAVRQHQQRFWQCLDCQQVYWQGSHYRRMQTFLEGLLQGADPS